MHGCYKLYRCLYNIIYNYISICARITVYVVVLCASLSLCPLLCQLLCNLSKATCHQASPADLNKCIGQISLNALFHVLATIADYLCLLHFLINSQCTKESVITSYFSDTSYYSIDSSLVAVVCQVSFLAFFCVECNMKCSHSCHMEAIISYCIIIM